MIHKVANAFTQHPASVDESFFQHMRFALTFCGWLTLAAGAAFVHAILPFAFEKTAGNIICRLHTRIHNRNAH